MQKIIIFLLFSSFIFPFGIIADDKKPEKQDSCKIKFIFISDFDGKRIIPDIITLDNNIIEPKDSFLPGNYSIEVEKTGYQIESFKIQLSSSDKVYLVKKTLISARREIEADIICFINTSEECLDPEILSLNGKDASEGLFKPGKYELKIQYPGFKTIQENIIIPPGNEPFLIQKELIIKPRKINIKIYYHYIDPPLNLGPHKVTLTPLEKPKEEKEIKENMYVKPASYLLKITKPAHQTIEKKIYIWPHDRPYVIQEKLWPKSRIVKFDITYDVPPMKDSFLSIKMRTRRTCHVSSLSDGGKIRVDAYSFLHIKRPGYNKIYRGFVEIHPSEEPYIIKARLIAKKRWISFIVANKSKKVKKIKSKIPFDIDQYNSYEKVEAMSIFNLKTKNKVNYGDTFQPGKNYHFRLKFKQYKTIDTVVKIVPGEEPQILQLDLLE